MEFIVVLLLWVGCAAGIGLALIGDRWWAKAIAKLNTKRHDTIASRSSRHVGDHRRDLS